MSNAHKRKRRAEPAMAKTAKVFWSGRSQAIRLPKEFRVSAYELRVSRKGQKLVFEPLKESVRLDKNGRPIGWLQSMLGREPNELDLGERDRQQERDFSWMEEF